VSRRGVIYLRPQDTAEGLACAHRLPGATPQEACAARARWHVLLTTGPQPAAVLLCDPHMQIVGNDNPYYDRHPAGTACAAPATARTWQHGQCEPKEN
jgi:hypothetical protein